MQMKCVRDILVRHTLLVQFPGLEQTSLKGMPIICKIMHQRSFGKIGCYHVTMWLVPIDLNKKLDRILQQLTLTTL